MKPDRFRFVMLIGCGTVAAVIGLVVDGSPVASGYCLGIATACLIEYMAAKRSTMESSMPYEMSPPSTWVRSAIERWEKFRHPMRTSARCERCTVLAGCGHPYSTVYHVDGEPCPNALVGDCDVCATVVDVVGVDGCAVASNHRAMNVRPKYGDCVASVPDPDVPLQIIFHPPNEEEMAWLLRRTEARFRMAGQEIPVTSGITMVNDPTGKVPVDAGGKKLVIYEENDATHWPGSPVRIPMYPPPNDGKTGAGE